jgi:hypothetical protein
MLTVLLSKGDWESCTTRRRRNGPLSKFQRSFVSADRRGLFADLEV